MGRYDRVPPGRAAAPWRTRDAPHRRSVLAVVHNVTSATRLLDVLPLLHSDPRLDFYFTWTKSSIFADGVPEMLAKLGAIEVPWDDAARSDFDLAVSASYGGDLHELRARLITVSHGMGYNKFFNRKAETERPKPKSRIPGSPGEGEEAFGFGPEWLLHDGRLVPSAIVLSHPEQLDRLKRACPQAAPAAVIAGDPCLDRLLVSRSRRAHLRRDLGVEPHQKLIVVTSTWGGQSLYGRHGHRGGLIDRLLAELPMDAYRVAAVLHPNIWHLHGRFSVESWLRDHRRSGLIVPPPLDGWRALLVAADCVIGDHGSVTFYGAALGTPVLMADFPAAAVAPDSPVAALGAAAPRLDRTGPLRPQLDVAMADHDPSRHAPITDQASSVPGESATLLRAAMYRLLDLDPPPAWTVSEPVPVETLPAEPVTATWTTVTTSGHESLVERRPAWTLPGDPPDGAHLVVDAAQPGLLPFADVIVERDPAVPPRDWLRGTLARHGCLVAAVPRSPGRCLLGVHGGPTLDVEAGGCDPAVVASAVHDRVPLDGALPAEFTIRLGARRFTVTARRA